MTSPVVAVVARQQHTPLQPRSEVRNRVGSERDFSTVPRDRLEIGRNSRSRAEGRVSKGRLQTLGKGKRGHGGGAEA